MALRTPTATSLPTYQPSPVTLRATVAHGPLLAFGLREATERSLTRRRQEKLVELCAERGIALAGQATAWPKRAMVSALLAWRDRELDLLQRSPRPDDPVASLRLHSQTADQRLASETLTMTVKAGSTVPRTPQHPPPTPLLDLADDPAPRTPTAANDGRLPPTPPLLPIDDLPDFASLNLSDNEVIAPHLLKKGKKIGAGGFKDVFRGRMGRYRVAIADMRGLLTAADVRELDLLRDFRHPNIVRFIGVCLPGPECDVSCQIVTELCTNGDLFHYMRAVQAPSARTIYQVMSEIAKGVCYLHDRKPSVVHRDIKSLNILVAGNGRIKIADFGLARVKQSLLSFCQTSVGTLNWQAPELWTERPAYNHKVDIYAAGLVFWELMQWPSPQYPFQGYNEWKIYDAVGRQGERPAFAVARASYGSVVCHLIERMWAQDPQQRPDMASVVKELGDLIEEDIAARLASAMGASCRETASN